MIVIDASVAVELLLRTPSALEIEKRVFAPDETIHAPHLMDLEVASVLRRYCAVGELTPVRAVQALEDLADLPVNRYPHDLFLPRIWQLRNNLTVYDAAYVALAECLDAILLTSDAHLAGAPGNSAIIEFISCF